MVNQHAPDDVGPLGQDAEQFVHAVRAGVPPQDGLASVRAQAGGKVGIVDADDVPSRHGTPPALLACELTAAGYRQTGLSVLEGGVGYLAIYEAPAAADRPNPAAIRPCRDETTRLGKQGAAKRGP